MCAAKLFGDGEAVADAVDEVVEDVSASDVVVVVIATVTTEEESEDDEVEAETNDSDSVTVDMLITVEGTGEETGFPEEVGIVVEEDTNTVRLLLADAVLEPDVADVWEDEVAAMKNPVDDANAVTAWVELEASCKIPLEEALPAIGTDSGL